MKCGRLPARPQRRACDSAAPAVGGQEGSTEGWLAAPDADRPHSTLALVRDAGGIVRGVVCLITVDGRSSSEQHWGETAFKLGGYIVRDARATPLRGDEALRYDVIDLGQREEEAGGGINQLLKPDVGPEVHLRIGRRAEPFGTPDNLTDADYSSRAPHALFEDINPVTDMRIAVRDPPPFGGPRRVGLSFHTVDQGAQIGQRPASIR